jgi:GT2 family glycosyltransferase
MRLHAVVVNYRTPTDLQRHVSTFLEHSPSCPWRLTVVNVDPLQPDLDTADEYGEQPYVNVLNVDSNIGYGRACNLAAQSRGDADVLAFFNADTWVRDDAVDECVNALHENKNWGVLGPRQTDSHHRLTHAGMFGTHTSTRPRGWREHDHGQYNRAEEAITVAGSAYFVKRSCWDELAGCELHARACRELNMQADGAFLPTQHYYEETWVSYHAWAHDWKVVYYGPAHVHHEWHRASKIGSAERLMPRSQAQFRHACDLHGIPRD